MDSNEFIKNFLDQFDEIDASEVSMETKFRELTEWSSMTALGIIGMIDVEYGVAITGKDIQDCQTVEDIFNLVIAKK